MNNIDVDKEVLTSSNLRLSLEGAGNTLKIARPNSAMNVTIHMLGNASVTIEKGCALGNLFIFATPGSSVTIGSGVAFNGAVSLLLHEPQSITIGDGCLFGGTVDLMISDMHSILDAKSGERINPAKPITIGRRVWVGQRSTVLKGVTIGNDSVIATGSVVTKDVPANCVAAGNPARVVREGVAWRFDLI